MIVLTVKECSTGSVHFMPGLYVDVGGDSAIADTWIELGLAVPAEQKTLEGMLPLDLEGRPIEPPKDKPKPKRTTRKKPKNG